MDGISKTLQALADPTRRKILQMLTERDMQAGEIGVAFAMKAPSVSHHLSVLKNAGLVLAQRSGQNIVYSLNTTVMQEFMGQMMTLFNVGASDERPE
jgi:ArsR family transcriptional regulator, arsenate/arsenite/antimonite-responsive transcriptional repressor